MAWRWESETSEMFSRFWGKKTVSAELYNQLNYLQEWVWNKGMLTTDQFLLKELQEDILPDADQ